MWREREREEEFPADNGKYSHVKVQNNCTNGKSEGSQKNRKNR